MGEVGWPGVTEAGRVAGGAEGSKLGPLGVCMVLPFIGQVPLGFLIYTILGITVLPSWGGCAGLAGCEVLCVCVYIYTHTHTHTYIYIYKVIYNS